MTMTPSTLRVGGRVHASAKPLRRYTAIAGSMAPRTVSSHTMRHCRSFASAIDVDQSVGDVVTPCDRSDIHPFQFGGSVGLGADRDDADCDCVPGGEVERGVFGGVVFGQSVQVGAQLRLRSERVDVGPASDPLDVVLEQCCRLEPVDVGRRAVNGEHRASSGVAVHCVVRVALVWRLWMALYPSACGDPRGWRPQGLRNGQSDDGSPG